MPHIIFHKHIFNLPCPGIFAYVILKNGVAVSDKEVVDGLKELVKKKIAAFAVPTAFLVCVVENNIISSVLQNLPAMYVEYSDSYC